MARFALQLSVGTMLFTGIAGLAGLVIAVQARSSATLGYALGSVVDVGSAAIVFWRFAGSPEDEPRLRNREKRASVGIAMAFIVLAVVTTGVAIGHLVAAHGPEDPQALYWLGSLSVIFLAGLAHFKFKVAAVLDSKCMKKDAISNLAGMVLSLGVCISTSLYESRGIWWLDAAIALFVSVLLFQYGMRTLLHNKWYDKQFWMGSGTHHALLDLF
jgi:divalent metal cation (Fe/Co/Zn/Cd) transporter